MAFFCVKFTGNRKAVDCLEAGVTAPTGTGRYPMPGLIIGAAYKILSKWQRDPCLDCFETAWDWEGTTGDALEDMVCFLEMQGKTADRNIIEKVLCRYETNGRICHTTEVEEGVMVWRVI